MAAQVDIFDGKTPPGPQTFHIFHDNTSAGFAKWLKRKRV